MSGTALTPQLLLMVKLVVVGLVIRGYWLRFPDVFTPMFRWMDVLPEPGFRYMLTAAFVVCASGLLLNRAVRVNCVILGCVFLVATLSSRVYYRNGKLFIGLLLLFTGLQERGKTPWLLWWQLAMLYFGAGLNKFLEVDWRTGVYFDYYLGGICRSELYWRAQAKLPGLWLPWALGWSVILMELMGALMLPFRKFRPAAVWLVACIHVGAAIMVANDYGLFLAVILASYLSCLTWPDQIHAELGAARIWRWVRGVIRRLDFDHAITWIEPAKDGKQGMRLCALDRQWDGWRALCVLMVWSPWVYVLAFVLLTGLGYWIPNAYVVRGFGFLGVLILAAILFDRMNVWLRTMAAKPSGTHAS